MFPVSIDTRPSFSFNPQALVGLLVVAAGLLLTADNLGLVESANILRFWPVGVLAVGIVMLRRATDTPSRTWALFVTGVGAAWTLSRLFGWPVRLSMIFPVGLVMIGLVIIQRAMGLERAASDTTSQTISDLAFWGGVERRVSTSLFRRADVTAIMGGVQLDFRAAAINGDAVIDLFVFMGGVEIKVPPDWVVSNQVVAIMGGASDKSMGSVDSKHRLTLRGFVLMGGVEVKS